MLKKLVEKVKKNRKQKKVDKIVKKIKQIKIQGATNIAKAALKAYFILPTKKTKKKLIKARPTEPLLINVLEKVDKTGKEEILKHLEKSQEKINKNILSLIKKNSVIFTHCHSTNVVKALIYAKKKGKQFEVYNTETRPLYQGRTTAKELKKAGIKVTTFVDSAARIALEALQGTKKADFVFFGCDAILKDGAINKIGSGMFSSIARQEDIPVYIIADSWKYTNKVKLEERDFNEVWKNAPVKIKNPAFEKIEKKNIKGIVSELGILTLPKFIKKAEK